MQKINIIIVLSFLLITLFIIGISSCKKEETPFDPNTKTMVLGVILPLDTEKGLLRKNAIRLAIDEINSAGGVGKGYFINIVMMSSEGADRKAVAAAAAKKIISEHSNVVGFISSYSSSTTGIVEDVSIPEHYPCISGSATSNSLSGISPYFHRLCPPDEFESKVISDRAKLYGISSAAIAVEEGDIYSQGLATAFQNSFGSGVLSVINFKKGDPDYMNKIKQLFYGDPEGILVSMLNPIEYSYFFDTLTPKQTTFILSDGLYTNDLFDADISQLVGEIDGHTKNFGAFPSADTLSDGYIHFKEEIWKKYNQQVASYNLQFYDIGYIYAMAIEKALMEVNTSDMAVFRDKVNEYIRIVAREDAGDAEVNPEQGWRVIQAACKSGGVDYIGASGKCDIDNMGNTITAYALFKVVEADTTYAFKTIEVIP